MDVLRQLEQRVKDQILAQRKQSSSSSEAKKQTLIKLERDFERVQATAQSCRAKVTRQQKQFQQRGAAAAADLASNSAANSLQQEQERFQMQMHEDVRGI